MKIFGVKIKENLLEFELSDFEKKELEHLSHTITRYKMSQRNEDIFYLDDEKNRCIAQAMELFFEEV